MPTDPEPGLEKTVDHIIRREGRLDLLVNNAGVGFFGPHETIAVSKIEKMVKTNLIAPLVLTRMTLRHLRDTKGCIINISSSAAVTPHRFGAAYGATKAGLLQFGECLFEEARKSGVRVVTLLPDMTDTPFYKNAGFEPSADPLCHITPGCVADAVDTVLAQRPGTVITQMSIRPQRVSVRKKPSGKSP